MCLEASQARRGRTGTLWARSQSHWGWGDKALVWDPHDAELREICILGESVQALWSLSASVVWSRK